MAEDALIHLLQSKYPTIDNTYANYQPVFLIDQMIAICEFEGIPNQMTPELIDRAWANIFVKDEEIVKQRAVALRAAVRKVTCNQS